MTARHSLAELVALRDELRRLRDTRRADLMDDEWDATWTLLAFLSVAIAKEHRAAR